VTLLTSCASEEQLLFEGTPDKTTWFTHFLAQTVETLPSPVSVREAYEFCLKGPRQVLGQGNEASDQEPMLTENSQEPMVLAP
jgi:hypothetical protein